MITGENVSNLILMLKAIIIPNGQSDQMLRSICFKPQLRTFANITTNAYAVTPAQ